MDHIVPLREGGNNELSNFQALCANCHALKTLKETQRYHDIKRLGIKEIYQTKRRPDPYIYRHVSTEASSQPKSAKEVEIASKCEDDVVKREDALVKSEDACATSKTVEALVKGEGALVSKSEDTCATSKSEGALVKSEDTCTTSKSEDIFSDIEGEGEEQESNVFDLRQKQFKILESFRFPA
jgi:hypothetical protein